MRRRLERAQRAGQVGKAVRLHKSDSLLGKWLQRFGSLADHSVC